MNQPTHALRRFALGLAIALAMYAGARADSVSVRSPDAPATDEATVYADVKINIIQQGRVTFTTSSGNSVDKDLASVVKMSIDDEPQFNQAQSDYANGQFDHAVDGFDQTIQNTSKPWLKAYCEPLLTEAANKAGRFDKAVQGYIWLVMNSPDLATKYRPAVPADSQYLDGAATALSEAVDAPEASAAQQSVLLAMLVEVDRARKDTAGMEQAADRLSKLTSDPNDPAAKLARRALADAKLSEANDALQQKNFDQAASIIDGAKAMFVDSTRQAEALFILAEARQGQADSKNDAQAWQDAAIAYLRVVAHFKNAAGAPHVADSLLKAAEILEGPLNKPDKALSMYQSIQSDYPNTPAAGEAATRISRLQSAGVRAD